MLDPIRQEALARAEGLHASPSVVAKVAKATSNEAASWAFTQWVLRKQARTKFALADQMLFTREALEQSTGEQLARYHASKFPRGVLAADLTTGIGADLIALAARGPAVGYELDEERAEYARHNLAAHGVEAEIRVADSLGANWDFELAFADPSRRVGGSRTLNPVDFQPNPIALGQRMTSLSRGVLKLTPMLPDRYFRELGGKTEFLSLGRECREALVIFGNGGPDRTAIHVETGGVLPEGDPPRGAPEPMAFLYEADPAAIRGDCLGTLARDLDIYGLGDSNGYLTGDRLWLQSCWLTPYRVLGSHRADVSLTKKLLSELGGGTPVIKSRAGIDVEALRKKLRLDGKRELIVAVYEVGRSLRHVILEAIR